MRLVAVGGFSGFVDGKYRKISPGEIFEVKKSLQLAQVKSSDPHLRENVETATREPQEREVTR